MPLSLGYGQFTSSTFFHSSIPKSRGGSLLIHSLSTADLIFLAVKFFCERSTVNFSQLILRTDFCLKASCTLLFYAVLICYLLFVCTWDIFPCTENYLTLGLKPFQTHICTTSGARPASHELARAVHLSATFYLSSHSQHIAANTCISFNLFLGRWLSRL